MQTPRIPGSGMVKEAGSTVSGAISGLKAVPSLPDISAPAILLPPGVRVPARTVTGMIPAKVRDLARYGQLAVQKIGTARRAAGATGTVVQAGMPDKPVTAQPPITHNRLPTPPVTTTPDAPRTKPVFGAPSAVVAKPTEKPAVGTALMRRDGDRAANPSGTPAFLTPGTVTGSGGDITRGMLTALDDVGDIMTFEYNPEEITVDHAGGWIITDQPGRTHPFIQFGGGGQRRISFTLRLFYTHNEVGDVLQNVNWLHSFLMGRQRNNGIAGAPRYLAAPKSLKLKLGQLFDNVPCILVRAPVTYKMLFRPASLLPLYAEIQMELLEIGGAGAAENYAERRLNAGTVAVNAQGNSVSPRITDTV